MRTLTLWGLLFTTLALAQNTPAVTPYQTEAYLSEQPIRQFRQAPPTVLKPGLDYFAELQTSKGVVLLDLYEDRTPITVNSFVFLSLNRYFDGLRFHRIVPGFVAQIGDPTTLNAALRSQWGSGGPGYRFGLEPVRELNYDKEGVVGMARTSDPNSNGSQFFITFGPTPNLNQQYTIFGQVTEGMDVVKKIAATEGPGAVGPSGRDKILSVRILVKDK